MNTFKAVLVIRTALIAVAALGMPVVSLAQDAQPAIHVVEGKGCECCVKWTEYLREQGFDVTSEERFGVLLIQHKIDRGVPADQYSCHTGEIDGYFLEGHVPAADIRRLLEERPDAAGLAVPGMPYGSPGMGPESRREAYDVMLVLKDGSSEVYNHYPAARAD